MKLHASVLLLFSMVGFVGCAADVGEEDDDVDQEEMVSESTADELRSVVSCKARTDTAYVNGVARSISVITVGGRPVAKPAGHAFLKMQAAAHAAGVYLAINSGFRTMAEQRYFYNCYLTKSCNNGNQAARPGYSNHQSGTALDLTTSTWLANNAARFGFVRTVAGEPWHYEFRGSDPGGVCGGGGGDPPCYSTTLAKTVPDNTCVQARESKQWFQCKNGAWVDRFTNAESCSSVHAL